MRVSRLLFRYVLDLCWATSHAIYRLLQRLIWLLTGTQRRLAAARQPQNYGKSAQVMKIRLRFKFDEYLSPAKVTDFVLTHDRFEAPEYVLQDHITLYLVNDKEAVFVEALPGQELWRAKNFTPFIMTSQFKHGVKVVRLPIASFYRLADEIGNPKGRLIFITNTARCGSTLLTQMMEVTNQIVTISEPSSLNFLAGLVEKLRTKETDRMVVAAVRVLCKPTSIHELAYALKLTAPTMQRLNVVAELFPEAKNLFMYRDNLKVAQSLYRLSEELYTLKTVYLVGRGSERRIGWCVGAMGMPVEDYMFSVHHHLTFGTILWAASVNNYLNFRKLGIDIAAVRYEDIIADPVGAMAKIFRYVGIPEGLAELSKAALEWDSQRNTPVSNERLARHATLKYEGAAKEECDRICTALKSPLLGQKYIAPGTITSESVSGVNKI